MLAWLTPTFKLIKLFTIQSPNNIALEYQTQEFNKTVLIVLLWVNNSFVNETDILSLSFFFLNMLSRKEKTDILRRVVSTDTLMRAVSWCHSV